MNMVMSPIRYILKRSGKLEPFNRNKVLSTISRQCRGLDMRFIRLETLIDRVQSGLSTEPVTADQLNVLIGEESASLVIYHNDYSILASRILQLNLYKTTEDTFSGAMNVLFRAGVLSEYHYSIVNTHRERLNAAIKHERDFNYTYIGLKTLQVTYLKQVNDKLVERIQYMWMRVAIGIHEHDIDRAIETYNLMSTGYFTHASSTLFNAATNRPQLASCFLSSQSFDNVKDVYKSLSFCADVMNSSGGLGVNLHNTPSAGSIMPLLRLLNSCVQHISNRRNHRSAAMAVYLEPWHVDVFDFLEAKRNTGKDEMRARDLFYGLWIPDLFMQRALDNQMWSLMDPQVSPGLSDCYGEEFNELYQRYEREGRFSRQIGAQELLRAIIESQVETGTPYMLYKDSCNRKSNHNHLGTIKCSNLCTEIVQYSSHEETAVCNLASIALNKFVFYNASIGTYDFDFEHLRKIVHVVTKNLNIVIDVTYYPTECAKTSNLRHRPIGIGVQGYADALAIMGIPYDSESSQRLNVQIFETIYYAALEASCDLAKTFGPYSTYPGSMASRGILQHDLWDRQEASVLRCDWNSLRGNIARYGLRNSLLVTPMPTASTSQILGNTESFEPITSNLYQRRLMSGEFQLLNKHLLNDLIKLNLWDCKMSNEIIRHNGSIQNITNIPQHIKDVYKTVWELNTKTLLNMAADRGAFIDQSQSFNIYLDNVTLKRLSSIHFYAWKLGLKTGQYYLRSKPGANAIKFTIDETNRFSTNKIEEEPCSTNVTDDSGADNSMQQCTRDCTSCSS